MSNAESSHIGDCGLDTAGLDTGIDFHTFSEDCEDFGGVKCFKEVNDIHNIFNNFVVKAVANVFLGILIESGLVA